MTTTEKLMEQAKSDGESIIEGLCDSFKDAIQYDHGGWEGDSFWDFKELLKGNEDVKARVVGEFIEGMKKFLDSPHATEVVRDLLDFTDFSHYENEDEDEESEEDTEDDE